MLAFVVFSFFAAAKPVHPFLYRVTVGQHVSYVLGTIASPLVSAEDFDGSLVRALTQVQSVYYENLDPLHSENEVEALGQRPSLLPPWKQRIGREATRRLRALLTGLNRGPMFSQIEKLPSSEAYLLVGLIAEASVLGDQRPPFPIETQMISRRKGLKTQPLNRTSENFELVRSLIGDAQLEEWLLTHLDERGRYVTPENQRTAMGLDVARYLVGQTPLPRISDPTPLNQALHTYREAQAFNHLRWYPRVLAAMHRGSVLVNVDVGHLAGPRGLVAKLSEEKDVLVQRLSCAVALQPPRNGTR